MTIPDPELLEMLAYRMNAISIGHLALCHQLSWDKTPQMKIFFDGKQVIEGKATGFTNAAIESAVIHCRAILEFLGLQGVKNSPAEIAEKQARSSADDWGVEQIPGLSMLTKDKALSAYPGQRQEAESALALIFHSANKGLAHSSNAFVRYSGDPNLLEIAFRGVPTLLRNGFYEPLGICPPTHELATRPRSD